MVEKFLPFVSQLIDENTFKKEDIYNDNTLNIFFQYFFQLQKYSDGKNYFLQFAKFLPKLEFNKIKSYILKQISKIKLNLFFLVYILFIKDKSY